MEVLVTGAGGLLGRKIVKAFNGYEVIGIYNTSKPETPKYYVTDLRKLNLSFIYDEKPDVIVHAAALTDADKCEEDKDLAMLLNYQVTSEISKAAEKAGSFLVYISTDYVFDGNLGDYRETDRPSPINFYGLTKLMGESAVMKIKNSLIVRTSTPYGNNPASGKVNFALWLIKKVKAGEEVHIVTDQFTSPTFNTHFALMLRESVEKGIRGIIHLADKSRLSRYEFAIKVAKYFNLDASLIKPVSMNEMKWKARRPRDSSLNVDLAMNLLNNKPLLTDNGIKKFGEELVQVL